MKLGLDLSILDELEELNPNFTYKGERIDPYKFFSEHSNISTVRLRVWNDPYDENGNPYGGGTNDIDATLRMALRAKEAGMNVLIDFHYSDFFADPSRQLLPKAWRGLSYQQILVELSNFTKKTLSLLKEHDIDVMGVQVGNEITHGLIYPFGKLDVEYTKENGGGFRAVAEMLKTASEAAKEIYPNTKIILHLERSGYFNLQDYYLSNLLQYDFDFDILGESYYTYWHGSLPGFKDSIRRIKEKYHKEIWLVEIGYEYLDIGSNHKNDLPDLDESEFVVGNLNGRIPFPKTKEGQVEYIKTLLQVLVDLDVGYAFYWEPCWIYMPHNGWAKPAGEIYCGQEPHEETVNLWISETFFDKEGVANPVVDIYTQQYVDSLKKSE